MAPDEYGFYSNVNPQKDHPAGARPANAGLANFASAQLSCSMAMLTRWQAFTPAWTCKKITDEAASGKVRPGFESAGVSPLSGAGLRAHVERLS